ncbi:MAG TPA: sulfatase-like hydrolase/transferase, partial [Thermoleophilaceae bacterium]|nr:sulfatase-like hydrolase/transferase [Thermoleophilaceae bacterium]
MRPNVLLVVLDAARRDSLEPYGAAPGSSPAIADVARMGSALSNAFATACWTAPSHASMFTGLLPRRAGMGHAPGGTPSRCRAAMEAHRERNCAEVLHRAGYATKALSANLWVSERSGFSLGFEEFRAVTSGRQARIHGGLRARAAWALEAARGRADDGAREAGQIIQGWLESPHDRPFFWFVNLVECHSPYLPPRPYSDVSLLVRLRAAEEARRH